MPDRTEPISDRHVALGRFLRDLRTEHGLSQGDVGRALEDPEVRRGKNSISRLESGLRQSTRQDFELYAAATGEDPQDLQQTSRLLLGRNNLQDALSKNASGFTYDQVVWSYAVSGRGMSIRCKQRRAVTALADGLAEIRMVSKPEGPNDNVVIQYDDAIGADVTEVEKFGDYSVFRATIPPLLKAQTRPFLWGYSVSDPDRRLRNQTAFAPPVRTDVLTMDIQFIGIRPRFLFFATDLRESMVTHLVGADGSIQYQDGETVNLDDVGFATRSISHVAPYIATAFYWQW